MPKLTILLLATLYLTHSVAATVTRFSWKVGPTEFPTSVFPSYYYFPARPTQEPQPAIYDPVLNVTFPYNLTNPKTIPTNDPDPVIYPVPKAKLSIAQQEALIKQVIANVVSAVLNSTLPPDPCSKCKAALAAAQPAAWYAPSLVPDAIVSACKAYGFQSNNTCEETYNATNYGAVVTQMLYFADVKGLDGQHICNRLSSKFCPAPTATPLNTTGLFPKPKPANARAPKASGTRVNVLHLTDIHLDPRYYVGAEASCTESMCCRVNTFNSSSPNNPVLPAPLYGSFRCDSPYHLVVAALQSVGPLTGTEKNGNNSLAWTIYTGDVVSHDPLSQLSRAYTEYSETSVYEMIKSLISGPVFPTLGNHDSNPEAIDAPHWLPGPLKRQQSWNYEHVAGLWLNEGWIKKKDIAQVTTHYGGYSIKNHYGLRIIAFNTDFWYPANWLNYINTTDADNSGVFSWMISELQKAEDAHERVWIIGHVLSGWDGSQAMTNPTNLFYQIVERYSPHVIANVLFGHNHEDQFFVYYANNGTVRSADTALSTGWITPSVTPFVNLNSGFRMYEVDTGDFNIYEAYTYYSDVSKYPTLNGTGPTFRFEYSTRDSYGPGAGWSDEDPLNATFWHRVTEAMEKDGTLVSVHNAYQGKMSIKTPNCTSTVCQNAKICYMRSGSTALSRQCQPGYGSVQGPFP